MFSVAVYVCKYIFKGSKEPMPSAQQRFGGGQYNWDRLGVAVRIGRVQGNFSFVHNTLIFKK